MSGPDNMMWRTTGAARTPGKLWIREHPANPDGYFVAVDTPQGHPYFGVTKNVEILSDEDYPTRRADAEFMVRAWNTHDDLVAALQDMVREFRAHDLPYGSAAYTKAIDVLRELGKVPG